MPRTCSGPRGSRLTAYDLRLQAGAVESTAAEAALMAGGAAAGHTSGEAAAELRLEMQKARPPGG